MSARIPKLTNDEIQRAFAEGPGARFPPILTAAQLAALFQISRKTVYEWHAKGRLDDAVCRRGKHLLVWRDRAVKILFNGKEW